MKMSSGEAFYSSLQSCSFPAPKFRCGGGSDTKFMTSMSVYVRGYISIAGTRQLFKCLHFDIQRWVTITLMFLMALFRHNSTFRGKKKRAVCFIMVWHLVHGRRQGAVRKNSGKLKMI